MRRNQPPRRPAASLRSGAPHRAARTLAEGRVLSPSPPARPSAWIRRIVQLLPPARPPAAAGRSTNCSRLDDPLDAGQVDALVLAQPLHLAQQRDVPLAVAAAAAGAPGPAAPAPSGRTAAGSAGACPASRAATEMISTFASEAVRRDVRSRSYMCSPPRSPRCAGARVRRAARRGAGGVAWRTPPARPGPRRSRSGGTCTSTVTSRSPAWPSRRATPLPRARSVRPLGVPGGTRSVTDAVERRHPQVGAEHRLGERDRHGQRQVVAGTARTARPGGP